ncbi:conserved Plasmodium protein, unknown function [Plasmodium malariae]|uniref:Uncharacterized protein n=1 Tax=Plasmodium malariae TaxID=5858 RepID=A0A1A8WUE2_PLAMA|nr:conserved Plasmodium protein, unknown function [Plasmodium malariae]
MGEYIRKIPFYNDYEKKKDLLKFSCLKEDNEDELQRNLKKKNMNDDVHFINNRTQRDILTERKVLEIFFCTYAQTLEKTHLNPMQSQQSTALHHFVCINKLKEDISQNYNAYEKKFPFLIDTTVTKPQETKSIRDVLNDIYEQDDVHKTRLSEDIKTKAMLLERRKKLFIAELSSYLYDNQKCGKDAEGTQLRKGIHPHAANYVMEVVKNKNKLLTLKNYGLGQSPSDFVFSYPDIKANSKMGTPLNSNNSKDNYNNINSSSSSKSDRNKKVKRGKKKEKENSH